METGTTFIQKKFGTKLTFQFGEEKLTRTLADWSGENEFSVPYDAIDLDNISVLTVNVFRRFVAAVFLIMLFLVSMLVSEKNLSPTGTLFTSGLILLCLAALIGNRLRWFSVKYTILPIPSRSGNNTIRIIHNKNHDIILKAIKDHWAQRLRKLHGMINFGNNPNQELNKFKWLKDHVVISELEYQDAVAKIRAAQEMPASTDLKTVPEKKDYLN